MIEPLKLLPVISMHPRGGGLLSPPLVFSHDHAHDRPLIPRVRVHALPSFPHLHDRAHGYDHAHDRDRGLNAES